MKIQVCRNGQLFFEQPVQGFCEGKFGDAYIARREVLVKLTLDAVKQNVVKVLAKSSAHIEYVLAAESKANQIIPTLKEEQQEAVA